MKTRSASARGHSPAENEFNANAQVDELAPSETAIVAEPTAASRVDLCPKLDERVALHPLRAEHADALFPILSDTDLWHYAPRPGSKSVEELRDRFTRLESRRSPDDSEHWLNWVIQEKVSAGIVGFVQATIGEGLSDANIAYALGRSFWGRGLASDAVAAMLAHLKAAGVRAFRATVDSRNLRSVGLLERYGFVVCDASDPNSVLYTMSALCTHS
jgi:ribosomal-protein-alanine N-acetyltransferase